MTPEQFKAGMSEDFKKTMREEIPEIDQDTLRLMFMALVVEAEHCQDLEKRLAALEKRHEEDDIELAKTAGVDHG